MEFHKKLIARKKPEIITKKKIAPRTHFISSHSPSNIPKINQVNLEKESLTEKDVKNKKSPDFNNENSSLIENVKKQINEKIDATGLIKNVVPSSLVINLHPKYQIKRPIKKTYSQIRNPNPLKQVEYQQQIQSLHSSQKSIPNSNQVNANTNSKNDSKDKNSNSSYGNIPPHYMHRSATNIKNINTNSNELEIEINQDQDTETSPKIRYHRPRKKKSPLFSYNNTENEEIIYNVPLTDEDSIGKNNFNKNLYYDAYEINEGVDPVQIRVLNKKYNSKDNILYGNPFLYSSDEALENSLKLEEKQKQKKFIRQYTDIYEPNKNKKGILVQKTKMTVPLTEGSFLDDKIRYFSRNSKLSDIIISKKKYSPDPVSIGYEDFYSGSEDKTTCQNEPKIRNLKTFNRRSFERFTQNPKVIKLHKSPEERFRNFSLAMVSSKGKNTENRKIFRKMRFEKGGVVDLAQDDGKKNKFKYLIKKMSRSPGKQLIHNNPKYREKAAELIQAWWCAIKEYRKKRIKSAILIQSCFRGRFTRKYLYDVIYMNYLYFGFCKKIEKFIRKKFGPYFLDCLFSKFHKQKIILKKIILNYQKKIIEYYLNKWRINTKNDNKKKLALLYLLRIRAIRDSKIFNLKRFFSKWNYITIIKKERSSFKDLQESKKKIIEKENIIKQEEENIKIEKILNDSLQKIKGLMKIINGTDKFVKKKALDIINPIIKDYMKGIIIQKQLKKLVKIREKKELIIIKKYLYIFYEKCFSKEIKENKKKKKIIHEYSEYDIDDKLEEIKKEIEKLKKMKIEIFIQKIEPFLSSKKKLHNLFLDSILHKNDKLKNNLEKYKKKLKIKNEENEESPVEDYEHKIKYKYKIVKKEQKEGDQIINSSSEEEEDNKKINKKTKKSISESIKEQKPIKKYIKKEKYPEEEEENEETEEINDIKGKKKTKKLSKEKNIKKPSKYDKKVKDDDEEILEDKIKKIKKYNAKDIQYDFDESEEEETDKNIKKKEPKNKNKKIITRITKDKEISPSEEEGEVEEGGEVCPKMRKKDKNEEIENANKSNKKIYTKKKIKSDKINIKDKEKHIKGPNKLDKKRKYRKKIGPSEKEEESEVEDEQFEEEEEEIEEIEFKKNKKKDKKRSLSLDKISEKSKELSDNIKEFSTISEDSKNIEKIRPNSEKNKNVKVKNFSIIKDKDKKGIKYDKKNKKSKLNKEKESEEEEDEFINKKSMKIKEVKTRKNKYDEEEEEGDKENEEERIKDKNKITRKIKKDKEEIEENKNINYKDNTKGKKIIKKNEESEEEEENSDKVKEEKIQKKENISPSKKKDIDKKLHVDEISSENDEKLDKNKKKKIIKDKEKIKYKKKVKKESENDYREEESEEEDNIPSTKKNKNKKKLDKKEKDQIDNNLKALDLDLDKNIIKTNEFVNFQKKYILRSILKIKKSQNDKLQRHYLNIWKYNKNKISSPTNKKNNDNILSKKYASKIIYIFTNNLIKKLLNKKFYQWRRMSNSISNEDNSLKKAKNINNFSDIIRYIITKKYFKDFIPKLKKYFNPNNKALQKIIINLIKKKNKQKNDILLRYLKKWYNISNNKINYKNIEKKITLKFIIKNIDNINKNKKLKNALYLWKNEKDKNLKKEKNIKIIVSWFKKQNKKNNKIKKEMLKRIIINKIKKDKNNILFSLLYWNKVTKIFKKSILDEKDKIELGKIFKNLYKKYYLKQIKDFIDNGFKLEEKDEIDSKGKDKDKDTNINKDKIKNGIISQINKIKKDKNKFKKLIISKIKKDNKDKLRNKFNYWRNNTHDYIEKLIIIQAICRQIISKNKLDNIKRLNNTLLNIFINREKNEKSLQIFNLRKWNMIAKKLSCINKIEFIQKYFKIYLSKKQNNKFKSFFINIYKSKLIKALNEIAKYNSLKLSIRNISTNRVFSKIHKRINKNKIIKLLDKIVKNIDNKNKIAKMKYYIDKWNNRVNYIKNKDNKKLIILLKRIFYKKDNLHNVLKSYFLRWKRIHNLLTIIDSVIKIQNNWRKKKSLDNYNKRKHNQNINIDMLKILDKNYKKNNFEYFIKKLKNQNKKYLLNKITNDLTNRKKNNVKCALDKIRAFIKYKYLSSSTKISENARNRIIKKYFDIWKNKTYNGNKIYHYLTKFIEKKDKKNKYLIRSILLKWLYHSKKDKMEEKVIIIQKIFKNFKNNNDSINSWKNLKNKLYKNKIDKGIKEIIKYLKVYKSLDLIKNNIKKKARINILKEFNHYNKVSLFIKKMKKIINQITDNKSSKSLKKYFLLWNENINKEIEREEKLSDLLYAIEKRMNINSANYLSYISLIKNIFDGVLNLRKFECFKKLKDFSDRNKNMNNLSKTLSLVYNDLKIKKGKNFISKIFKYFIYKKLLKLFETIKKIKSRELKNYKTKLIKYLQKKLESDISSLSDNSKKNRNSNPSKMLFKPKQKVGMKQFNKSNTKTQLGIKVNLIKNDPKKTKEKEKDKINGKDKIRKNIVIKGSLNKSTNIKKEKDKDKDNINNEKVTLTHKSEEESEGENEIIKENINYLYISIEKIFTKRIKETLYIFKEKVYKVKTEKEKEEEKVFYTKKLYKALKNMTIKKIFIQKEEICRAKKLINLIKITTINSQISADRWIRQLLRRWRFISFVKNVSKRKMELMYKNLHVGYLEIINSLFNNESQFPSMIKEFENFGTDVGMYKNTDYYMNREKELYQRVKKKYIAKPIEYDRENSLKIESGKFINELKYKSDEGEDTDFFNLDSEKDVLKKGAKISNNYDRDK